MKPVEGKAGPWRPGFKLSERLQWMLAGCIVVAVLCLGNFDLIVGRSTPDFDTADYFGPEFSLIADHIKAGRLLLWDPWVAAGTPDSAEPEFGTTSPVVLAAALLSPGPQAGFVMYWIFIWTLGPIGLLVLCRHLGCPAWGGLIAALGFAASGFYTAQAQHTAHLYSVSFLPWVIWRFDLALARNSYWGSLQAGILYGLSALGGYPVYTIVTPGFLALWSIGRVLDDDKTELHWRDFCRKLRFPSVAVVLLIVVGVAVMSPAYIGFFTQTRGYSDRNGPRSREDALRSNIFPAGDLVTIASPYLTLLDVPPSHFWPFSDVSMRSIYVGCVAATLAFLALLRRSRWRWWLLLLAALFLCCAMGYQTPLRAWLYDYVIPTRYFRNAASFRTYAILLFVILAALGAKDLSAIATADDDRVRRNFLFSSVVLAVLAGWTFALVVHLSAGLPVSFGRPLPSFSLAITHAVIAWCGVALCAYLLVQRKLRATAVYGLLVAIALFDGMATLHISSVTMYSPTMRRYWHAMNVGHTGNLNLSGQGLARDLEPPAAVNLGPHTKYHSNRNLPLKVATIVNYITLTNRFYTQIAADPLLSGMALGKNRIWFIAEAPYAPLTDANFAVYAQQVHQLKAPVVVLHSREQMNGLAQKTSGGTADSSPVLRAETLHAASLAPVSQLSYWPNAVSFHYLATEAGWLIFTDRWAPGWKVAINGQAREVAGADFVYRAVKVEAGDNFVQFRYRPRGWPWLLFLSWGTLFIAGTWEVVRVIFPDSSIHRILRMKARSHSG